MTAEVTTASSISSGGSRRTFAPHPNAHAARSLASGLSALAQREAELLAFSQALGSPERAAAEPARGIANSSDAVMEADEERIQRLHAEDEAAVQEELKRYGEEAPPVQEIALLEYWQRTSFHICTVLLLTSSPRPRQVYLAIACSPARRQIHCAEPGSILL
ncbi:hypothetical protein C8Q70DRAFT_1149148 [Cubamyces menziesii]|nr:hypothetical protein C8Q70DRAFT_1149148 [Cubamyces menziesii]